jgi:hypothetical protein
MPASRRHDPGANRQSERDDLYDQFPRELQEKVDAGMPFNTALRLFEGKGDGDPNAGPALYDRLKLLEKIASPKALALHYRVVALTETHIRAAAPFGTMRASLDLGLDLAGGEACVDAADFLGVLKTAPDKPFAATIAENALHWSCGTARGHLSLIDAQVPVPDFRGRLASLAHGFGPALELGALACGQSNVLRSAGLEGVQLYNEHGRQAYAVASDGTVVSSCCLGPALPMADNALVTLKPQAADILADVVKREPGEMFVGVDDNSLYFFAPSGTELHLNQLAPLPLNFADKLAPFTGQQLTVPLLYETVAAFLKRAEMLAEVRREAMVDVTHQDGRTTLAFREASGSTSEYYDIVTDGPKLTADPVRVEVRRLAKALKDADRLVFDYTDKNILVLRGENEFIFAIYGQAG